VGHTHTRFNIFVVVGIALVAVACADPLNPSGTPSARLHVGIDGATCGARGVSGSFNVFIDGKDVGVTTPGSDGITKDVGVGSHSVSARHVQDPAYVLAPQVIDVPQAGFSFTVFCT
jgi:hypothetical protein